MHLVILITPGSIYALFIQFGRGFFVNMTADEVLALFVFVLKLLHFVALIAHP
jgi:hypothetical protein